MIRVNLLEGTAEQRVAMQKTKVAARRGQQLFMLAAALLIFVVAIAIDHLYTHNALASANSDLQKEQEEAKKLEADIARKTELENQIRQLEERIKVIKQLRAEQKGPVAMLSAINERIPGGSSEFQLQSIVQKGHHLQIIGSAPNQQALSDFFHQLEFSNGLFANLTLSSIEGREVKLSEVANTGSSEADETTRIFKFTIDCDFNKPHDAGSEADKQGSKPAGAPAK
jgi:Tfp pilus assembly protein PilN